MWAPFSLEEHNFVEYLRTKGFNVISTHWDPETGKGENFLTYEPDFEFDVIVDNPPFKGKTHFVERAFYHGKPWALFLPIQAMGDNGVPNAFMENNAEPQMLIPKQRTEFHNQVSKGISFKTIYICDRVLDKQIVLADMNKVKLITEQK